MAEKYLLSCYNPKQIFTHLKSFYIQTQNNDSKVVLENFYSQNIIIPKHNVKCFHFTPQCFIIYAKHAFILVKEFLYLAIIVIQNGLKFYLCNTKDEILNFVS